mgnify:CR=1 FL=1
MPLIPTMFFSVAPHCISSAFRVQQAAPPSLSASLLASCHPSASAIPAPQQTTTSASASETPDVASVSALISLMPDRAGQSALKRITSPMMNFPFGLFCLDKIKSVHFFCLSIGLCIQSVKPVIIHILYAKLLQLLFKKSWYFFFVPDHKQ